MFPKKLGILQTEYQQTTVQSGSQVMFFFCFWLTKLFSLLQPIHPLINRVVHAIVHELPKPEFVIKNSRGTFLVEAFDDSTTICSTYFETELRNWLNRPTTKATFVDIGANRGIYTIMALREYGFGTVHAFEPNPDVFKTLEKNIELNKLQSTTKLHNAGVGEGAATHTLAVDPMHKGGGHITSEKPTSEETMNITVVTLDSVLTPSEMTGVGFIKIDTEGYEKKVLAGMTTTLSQMPAGSCLMIETTELSDIQTLVAPYGFTVIERSNNDYLFAKEVN